MSESQEIKEIKRVYAGLETLYHSYFPKSDPSLIHDLLRRLKKNPNIPAIYMVEVFTKPGVNPEAAKKYIFEDYQGFLRCLHLILLFPSQKLRTEPVQFRYHS